MKTKNGIIILMILSILLGGCANMDKKLITASSFVDEGSYDKAIKIYKDLLDKNQDNPNIYMALANAYKKMGDEDAEEVTLKEGLIYCDNNEEIYDVLVDLYESNNEKDKFLKLYERYKDKIYSEKAILYTSTIYKSNGEDDLSFQELQKIDIDKTENVQVLEALLPFYLGEDSKEKLKEIVNKGISINSKGTVFHAYKYLSDRDGEVFIRALSSDDLDNDGMLENVFVISDKNTQFGSTYAKLIVQNGMTGQIIDEVDLGPDYEWFYIEFGNLTDMNKKDILLDAHGGGMGTPSYKLLYGFDKGKLKEKDLSLADDLEHNYLDDFKIELASKEFDRVYSLTIDKDHRDEYIREGYYTRNGKVMGEFYGYGLEVVNVYHIEELARDGLVYQLPFHGSYMMKDFLGYVNVIYVYDGGWKPYSMEMRDYEGNEIKYKKYDEKSKLPDPPKVDETIVESKRILNMSKSEVIDNFGQPNMIDHYQAEFYAYDDKLIFFNNDKVSAMWWTTTKDKFGIKGKLTNQKIREALGSPSSEGIDETGETEYTLYYEMEGLNIHFSDIDESYGGYILVKKLN